MENYKGYTIVSCDDNQLATFYEKGELPIDDPLENSYIIIKNSEDQIIDERCWQRGSFRTLQFKPVNTFSLGKLNSRNVQQDFAFDLLQDTTTPIKILAGRYGSGKTLLMLAHAVDMLEHGKIDRLIYIRNNIELKDTTPLGALPGGKDDKMIVWAAPLGDHLGGIEAVIDMIGRGKLEISPLNYLRGRDFKRSIIFCDESENLTTSQCQLLIGRVGEGSQLWLAGDRRQTDKYVFENDSGMKKMIDRLSGKDLFGHVYLDKSERSEAAAYSDYLD